MQRDTRIRESQFEAESRLYENDRDREVALSDAELSVSKAEFARRSDIATVEAKLATEIRNSQLQKDLEAANTLAETERLRATILADTKVRAEAKEREADAELYVQRAKAEGIRVNLEAQADGLKTLLQCSDPDTVLKYLMIDRKVFTELAAENAKAVNGLNPKIVQWNTGGSSDKNPITDLIKNLPPLLDTIQSQTGMSPPKWLMEMDLSKAQMKD